MKLEMVTKLGRWAAVTVNRDGILFGPGAVVNTAGFLATTHDIGG